MHACVVCEIEDFVERRFSDRAYYGLCVLIEDIGRRLPLQLQCSYQGQHGDVSQSAETIKPVSEGNKI